MSAVTVTAKGWAKSKTILLNGAVALPLVTDQLVELVSTSDLFPDDVSKWLLFALALANIFLRAATSQPVASSPIRDQSKVVQVEKPLPRA